MGQIVNYYVFQVSDQSKYGKQRKAQEVFDFLVKDRSAWGFGYHTPNRKAIKPGDKVVFYLTGTDNQVFVGAATLASGAYENNKKESKDWFLDPKTLRIDLEDVVIFDQPKPRKNFKNLEYAPAQGGSSKISERDYEIILGRVPDISESSITSDEDMEFALEEFLEDFMVKNWEKINFDEKMTIFKDENGNIGKQYYTDEAGYIDILAKDDEGFVVIELKKGRKNDEVVGQVLRYMGWVRRNLAKANEKVKGMIIVRERDPKLEYALQEIGSNVTTKIYQVSFKLRDY